MSDVQTKAVEERLAHLEQAVASLANSLIMNTLTLEELAVRTIWNGKHPNPDENTESLLRKKAPEFLSMFGLQQEKGV